MIEQRTLIIYTIMKTVTVIVTIRLVRTIFSRHNVPN